MINKYYKRWEISEAKFRQLIRLFAMDFTATDSAELTGLSRRSVTTIYGRLREKITRWSDRQAPIAGMIEVDESYFGPQRIPSKRGRGASGKTIVFEIFKRRGQVYTDIARMLEKRRFSTLFEEKWILKA